MTDNQLTNKKKEKKINYLEIIKDICEFVAELLHRNAR